MDLQDQSTTRKAAAPVFAQLPVFSYNGNEESIENTEQTFEELRLAKADDFPEFDEAQSISWSVTYGKISKSVEKPRKTKIGDFKREIESSKEFIPYTAISAQFNLSFSIANIKNPDKRAGQGAGPYRRFVGAAALGGPLASILKIAIVIIIHPVVPLHQYVFSIIPW